MDNLYYIAVHFEDKRCMGAIQDIGQWDNHYVYEVDADTISRLDFTNTLIAKIPTKEIAYGWKFAGDVRDFLRVGARGIMAKQLGEENLVPHKPEKFTYYITDEDRKNGVKFAKIVLKARINRDFKNIIKYTQDIYLDTCSAYANYVYASNDASLIADLETNMPKLAENHKNYNRYLRHIVSEMHNLELMVDSIETPEDVRGVQAQMMVTSIDLPKTLTKDREIADVQRTVKS
jgi:hypothetical protein